MIVASTTLGSGTALVVADWAQARVRGGPDETLSLAESVEFAAGINFVDETQWRATYQVAEPSFEQGELLVAIDKGGSDGIEVGMIVESNGAPIGRVRDVTDFFSDVLLVSSPDFSVDAVVAGTAPSDTGAECRVRGGNDHVGYVCDRPLIDQERVGAEIIAASDSPTIVDGTSFGTITSIVDINGESVALLDLLSEFPIAGDTASVIVPS